MNKLSGFIKLINFCIFSSRTANLVKQKADTKTCEFVLIESIDIGRKSISLKMYEFLKSHDINIKCYPLRFLVLKHSIISLSNIAAIRWSAQWANQPHTALPLSLGWFSHLPSFLQVWKYQTWFSKIKVIYIYML